MAIQPQVTAGSSRQRLLVLALAGLLVLALVLLVVRPLLLGTSQAEAPAAPPVTTTATTGAATTLIPPSTSPVGSRPPGTIKDPFHPLVVAGAAGPTPTTAGVTATTVAGGGATAEREVKLVDVFSRSGTRYAKVTVDGSPYTVKEGQSFATDYWAVDIGSTCATFESGPTRFTLCEDEAILK
jgi:hypothetical protein